MGRRNTPTHKSTAPSAPALVPGPQLPLARSPLPTLQAAWRWANLLHPAIPRRVQIVIKLNLELEISLTNDFEETENNVDTAVLDETIGPEPVHELEGDIPAIQNIVEGGPGASTPLMGSLHGIIGRHA